ncbi:EIN3-binding F-box protein 2 [Nymphaea thermarum]|nr:EIN3-binding F-box protein 2 [Nymphaea thermarum]
MVVAEVRRRKKTRGLPREGSDRENPFNRLPDECIAEIFSYNPDPTDRWLCAAVCKKFLLLQAHMKISDFKVKESANQSGAGDRMKRCLEGSKAMDTRLAAMAVCKWAKGIVGDLSIRGDFLVRKGTSYSTRMPHGVTDCGLDIVGSGFPCLKSLALWGCLYITNKGLVCVSRGCALLEKLDLCECPLITDEGMVAVARGLRKLTTLSVESCRNIGNSSLKAFGAYTPTLHSITVKGCRLVGDEGVFAILAGLPNLKRLKLAQLRANLRAVLVLVRHCRALASLSLEGYSFDAAAQNASGAKEENEGVAFLDSPDLRSLARFRPVGMECSNLKSVSISGSWALNDEGLVAIGRGVGALEKFALEACHRVSFSGLVEFLSGYAKNLKSLSLTRCNAIVETSRSWAGLNSPPSCNKLETLMVECCVLLGDAFLGWIGSVCSNLREVEFIGLEEVSDGGLASLLMMGSGLEVRPIERVTLNGCTGITDSSISEICRCFGPQLKSLSLGDCPRLSGHCLRVIAFYCTELRDLDVSGGTITDADLAHLHKMLWLTTLNLRNCPGLSQKAIDSFELSHFECDLVC